MKLWIPALAIVRSGPCSSLMASVTREGLPSRRLPRSGREQTSSAPALHPGNPSAAGVRQYVRPLESPGLAARGSQRALLGSLEGPGRDRPLGTLCGGSDLILVRDLRLPSELDWSAQPLLDRAREEGLVQRRAAWHPPPSAQSSRASPPSWP